MISRMVTPERKGRRWLTALASLALISSVLVIGSTALGVHDDGVFQLESNAIDDDAGDDWENIFDNNDTADATTEIQFDDRGPTIFTGGGSKDDLDTTGWKHKSGSVPDKDELLDAYAARYGDVVYFGADRYDASGAAALGFWFFQEAVGPQTGGSFGPGQHADGDILILSDFSVGGGTVTIRVFQWNGPGGTIAGQGAINGVLDLLAGTSDPSVGIVADCDTIGNPHDFCATVNDGDETSPWPFDPKDGANDVFAAGEFYEGGIDLGAFPQLAGTCFASFLAETRTSPSVGSQLKDFVGGGFEDCTTDVTTTPSNAAGDPVSVIQKGGSIHDYALIEGTGSDNAPEGEMEFFICSPAQLTGGVCATGGTEVNGDGAGALNPAVAVTQIGTTSDSKALSSAFNPTSTGTWCWRGEYSGDGLYPPDSDSSSGECFLVVDAEIDASPLTFTNEVNDPDHDITATVKQDIGAGPVAVSGALVTFSLNDNTAGATFKNDVNTCTTGAAGTCTITITTTATGSVDINASTTFSISGLSVTRSTDGTANNSVDANKRYVDAQIDLSPLTATNNIGDDHLITATVQQDDGLAAGLGGGDAVTGFGPAPNGTLVTFSFVTNTIGATFVGGNSTCTTTGGTCSITIDSTSAGTVTVHATTTFNIGPAPIESVTRATGTGGLNSADAQKTWVSGSLSWTKHNNAGQLLGGATFEVCRTDIEPDACFSVTDNVAPDTNATAGQFTVTDLALGDYSVTETAAPAGFALVAGSKTATLTFESPSATIAIAFVNNREVLKISGFGYTNAATGTPTSGVLSGTTVFDADLVNYGSSAANLTGSSLVVTFTGTGTVTCNGTGTGGRTLAITGTVAANGGVLDLPDLTCTYSGMSDGAVITATLTVKSLTNGVTRDASGSPATISFTVQGD